MHACGGLVVRVLSGSQPERQSSQFSAVLSFDGFTFIGTFHGDYCGDASASRTYMVAHRSI